MFHTKIASKINSLTNLPPLQIAAAHVSADSVIHFGHACLSKVTRLPVLYVFPKNDVNVDKFVECFRTEIPDKMEKVFIFYDVGSFHAIGE